MRQLRDFAATCILYAILGSVPAARASTPPYSLVVNHHNAINAFALHEAKDVFTGKKRVWPSGDIVQIVLCKADLAAVTWLAESVCAVPAKTLLARIRQEVFREQMAKPILAESTADVVEQIRRNKGGIGVLSQADIVALPAEVVPVALPEIP